MSSLAWTLARRFRRSKHKNRFVNFISASSTTGIALGCAALIVLLSVMNGFQKALEEQLLSLVPHVEFQAVRDGLRDWRAIVETAESHPQVIAAAPVTIVNSMLQQGRTFKGVSARAIDTELEPKVSGLTQYTSKSDWARFEANPDGILLGYGLAADLGLHVGDRVTLLVPRVESGRQSLQAPRRVHLELVGTFRLGGELDYQQAYIHLERGQQAMGLSSEANGVRLLLRDVYQAPIVASQVASELREFAYVSDWTRTEGHLYRDIQLVRSVMYLVLVLVLAVASFNIVSTLVMVVQEKRSAIAILKTMGADDSVILRSFVLQGTMNGVLGIVIGGVSGVLLAWQLPTIFVWLEATFGFSLLPADIYFVSAIPTQIQLIDVVLVLSVALLTSVLATLYPAWKAARINPARALSGE
ncbi:lipoprotein-releasing ABC transporter permease subunit [Aliidiomarina maris]|uniref:Lipoprotein-releasing system permease protein n=1 Tax=Aliidiomarina maris TaxID=531312 RepID=A0A327X366_9GAMM|nr:lipoprotein-releasing ABC transporter permease subunit [Aliidiomarina maris]RAK01540.1 lipoprotein-releasing system permease protein [Aliidiomarina maris]RUO28375.1 lipoprotein-releasing system transmembrane subunit, LolC/LolE family [Aliidiomarina maris]